ncbi:MAG: RpiB/LacA/LacB family sugar-phosphate isomerase [Flavobacteriales bacterium]|nr:RpiB/LacA/LacB family sugar-phosphate isomerase [Flavobacteriales bacterium]
MSIGPITVKSEKPKVIGIAADHAGYELKEYLVHELRKAGAEVIDLGASQLMPDDDYPDFVIPLARAVSAGTVDRGIAICGSGVGVTVAANKVPGVRACLTHDPFSARQGVEDDDLNVICLGGLVIGHAIAWELVKTFLGARFSGEERHRRRLAKVAELEVQPQRGIIGATPIRASVPQQQDIDPESRDTQDPGPLRLFLVRHGETAWSLTGQYTGSTDIALTAHGEQEARNVGERLRDVAFTQVLASPLIRARRTCELAVPIPAFEIEPDLIEWDNGTYEGRTPTEILAERPEWNHFRDGSPHGETPESVAARADRLIERLRTLEGNIALFSHGHFLRVLAARWIGESVTDAQHLLLDTAALSILCYEHGDPDMPAIELWNSGTQHSAKVEEQVHERSRTEPIARG